MPKEGLTLDRRSRVFRTYAWCLDVWEHFCGIRRYRESLANGDNLCHFVRTIVIAAPTAIAGQLIAWGLVIYCVLYEPCEWFGWWPYFRVWGWLATGIGIIIACVVFAEWSKKRFRSKKVDPRILRVEAPQRIGSFTRLARVYSSSRLHDLICPYIEFDGEEVD